MGVVQSPPLARLGAAHLTCRAILALLYRAGGQAHEIPA